MHRLRPWETVTENYGNCKLFILGGPGTIDYLCDSSFFLSVLQVLTLGFREGYGAADRRCLVGARDEIRYTRRESGKRAKRKNNEDGKEQEKVKEQKAWRWYKRAGVGESETYAKVKRKQKGIYGEGKADKMERYGK